MKSLEHRRFLAHREGFRPFRGSDRFARIGGQAAVDRLVDSLYDRFEQDEVLRPMFGRHLVHERASQKRFFAEWLGGPAAYSQSAYVGLYHRHDDVPIARSAAGRWLAHFQLALKDAVADELDRDAIFEQARALALRLINDEEPGTRVRPGKSKLHRSHAIASCGGPTLKRAREAAQRGDLETLQRVVDEAPDLVHWPTRGAELLHLAVVGGRLPAVRYLLRRGVDVDKPHALRQGDPVLVTPLCAARMKRRAAIETLLLDRGARDDVFTAAFTGDTAMLADALAAAPALAQATDPAVDVLDVTPVHHAVAGAQRAALAILLERATPPLLGDVRALQRAVAASDEEMVERLLASGADASRIGVGRWVLHPVLAPLLAARGAKIDASGTWIGAACTGNQGRKDDPDFVRALLRHGARATDRRSSDAVAVGGAGQGVLNVDATALHYAAKAGFLKTIVVLLEHGADPSARDAHGRTPADWLDDSAKSVDKKAVLRLLARGAGRAG
jgi:truncated hemoglobin YjbI/ankyrin repeat protein